MKRAPDYIDTSVFIGGLIEEDFNCRKYLQTVGYSLNKWQKKRPLVLSRIE